MRFGLLLTKLALVVTVAGSCFFVREKRGWPLVNWTMYSDRWPPYPKEERHEYQLVIETTDGASHRLWPWEVLPMDRYKLVEVIVKRGFREPDPATRASVQAYTARLLGRALDVTPESIRHVELRQLTWSTQPMKLPPMDRDDVKGERSVGGFKLGEARGS